MASPNSQQGHAVNNSMYYALILLLGGKNKSLCWKLLLSHSLEVFNEKLAIWTV